MNEKYSYEQVLKAGSELVEYLLQFCNTSNNTSGFLKEYLDNLMAEDGIFKHQMEAMENFSKANSSIESEAQIIMNKSKDNSEKINKICQDFDGLNNQITQIQNGRREMNENVARLNKEIKEIGEFIKDIQNVSEQTHLLSFNASIEAARAGNAGKGFRIIANEVKKLSDTTTELSNNIFRQIQDLEQAVNQLVEKNAKTEQFVDNLQVTAVESNEKLSTINQDTAESLNFTEHMLLEVSKSRESITHATSSTTDLNIAQVRQIADKAAENNVQVNDQLSFLLELKALFVWLSEYKTHLEESKSE